MNPVAVGQAVVDAGNANFTVIIVASLVAALLVAGNWIWMMRKTSKKMKDDFTSRQEEQTTKVLEAVADSTRRTSERIEVMTAKIEVFNQWREMVDDHMKRTDIRLNDGNKTFENVKNDVQTMKEKSIERLADVVGRDRFEKYCHDHENAHHQLNRDIMSIKDSQGELKVSFSALSAEIKASIATVSGIMSRVVTLGESKKD